MGPKAKIGISILLITIVALGVWQFSSPPGIPVVGTKYLLPVLPSHQGSWSVLEKASSGSLFLVFTIQNLTYAREALSTTYSVIISKLNQTINGSLVRSFSLRVTGVTILDNYDGSSRGFDAHRSVSDAVQVTSLFTFKTPNDPAYPHQLRFTIDYDLYDLYFLGYSVDHSQNRSFNITQNIL